MCRSKLCFTVLFAGVLGFSVLAEDQNPPLPDHAISRLRFKQFIKIPYRIILKDFEVREGQLILKKNYPASIQSASTQTKVFRVGDFFPNTPYKIVRITSKIRADNYGAPKDASEIEFIDTRTNRSRVITLGVIADSPDTYVLFAVAGEKTEFKVKREDEFEFPIGSKIRYRIKDIQNDLVEIMQTTTRQIIQIHKEKTAP